MVNIGLAQEARKPVVYLDDYKTYYEIVYRLYNEYGQSSTPMIMPTVRNRTYAMVDFKDCVNPFGKFIPYQDKDRFPPQTPHAYGLMINPYNTRLIVLDLDREDKTYVGKWIDKFLESDIAEVIDVAVSSRREDGTPTGWHIYVGLVGRHNVMDFYQTAYENYDKLGLCEWFCKFIGMKHDLVIRTSQKFYQERNRPTFRDKTTIQWEDGYKKENGTWLRYSQQQLIAPLRIADGVSPDVIPTARSPRLRLRG